MRVVFQIGRFERPVATQHAQFFRAAIHKILKLIECALVNLVLLNCGQTKIYFP
jgi:hypothetical protein